MKATAIRKLRKELQAKAYRFRRDCFDDVAVVKVLRAKYDPLFKKVLKSKAADLITVSVNPRHNRNIECEVKPNSELSKLTTQINKEYKAAHDKWESESNYGKWKRIDSRLEALEVECLLGEVSDKSPEVVALMDEIRLLLTAKDDE